MLGKRIRQLREAEGYSQEDLGNIIGIKRSTITEYESGRIKPSYAKIKDIAKVFNVTVDYLMGEGSIDGPKDIYVHINRLIETISEENTNVLYKGKEIASEFREMVVIYLKYGIKILNYLNKEE